MKMYSLKFTNETFPNYGSVKRNATVIIYRTFPYTIRSSIHVRVTATHIDLQQLLFTASSVDFPFSNTILDKKKCILVGSLRLKQI